MNFSYEMRIYIYNMVIGNILVGSTLTGNVNAYDTFFQHIVCSVAAILLIRRMLSLLKTPRTTSFIIVRSCMLSLLVLVSWVVAFTIRSAVHQLEPGQIIMSIPISLFAVVVAAPYWLGMAMLNTFLFQGYVRNEGSANQAL